MAGRSEFVIRDLAVSIRPESGGGSGGTWMPAEEGTPLPPWLSPIAAVVSKGAVLEAVGRTIVESVNDKVELERVIMAFDGDPDGNPSIRRAIQEVGAAVVAGAAYQPVGGEVGYPDPECGGTSLETIPPTITPIVHMGLELHRMSELPRLRKQLEIAVEALDEVSAGLQPRGEDVEIVAKRLDQAREGLGRATAAR